MLPLVMEALGLALGPAAEKLAARLVSRTLARELQAELPALAVHAAALTGVAEPLAALARSPPLPAGDSAAICRELGLEGAMAEALAHHIQLAVLARLDAARLAKHAARLGRKKLAGAGRLLPLAEPGFLAARREELVRTAEVLREAEAARAAASEAPGFPEFNDDFPAPPEPEPAPPGPASPAAAPPPPAPPKPTMEMPDFGVPPQGPPLPGVPLGTVPPTSPAPSAPAGVRSFSGATHRLFVAGRGFDFRRLVIAPGGWVTVEMEARDPVFDRLLGNGEPQVIDVVAQDGEGTFPLQGCVMEQGGPAYRLRCRPEP